MQNTQKKKITNFRPILISALAMMIACAFAVSVVRSVKAKLIIAVIFAAMFVMFILLRVFLKIKIFATFSAVCLFISLPFLSLYFKASSLNEYTKFNDHEIVVSGKICETKLYSESSFYVVLEDAKVTDETEIKLVSGKVSFYVSPRNLDIAKLKNGRLIEVYGKFTFYSLNDEEMGISLRKLSNDIVARGRVNYFNVKILDEYKPSLRDKVCDAVKNKLNGFAGEYADLGYAMLFGDSSSLDGEIVNTFRSTGVAHILAVSGLHVSIIILALNFVLKLVRSPRGLNIILIALLLIFYCYLCNFSISVIRASLMAILLLFTEIRGKPYDRLNSLSLVSIIVLGINPLQLFNISYVLSFSAVFSIILFERSLARFFGKHFYKPIANSLALVCAVQIMMFVASIYYFGKYPLLGVVTNFVTIPIASLSFILLVFLLILSFVLPFLSILLKSFSILISLVVKFNFWITSLGLIIDFVNIKITIVIATLVVMFLLSDYVFIKRNTKVICSLIIFLVCMFVNLVFFI